MLKKILITGGAGFIGSHLVESLIKKNKIIIIDDLSTGNMKNLEKVISHKNLKFIKKDLNSKKLDKYFKNVSIVYHLAAQSDIIPSVRNPKKYFDSNVNATVNLLEYCKKYDVRKIVYAASSSCYGVPKKYPTNENEKIDTRYPYSFTKYIAEQTLLHWGQIYNINIKSLRLFNVFGPRVRTIGHYGAMFGVFLAQKANKFPLTIVGDGKQMRDFTFVSDVVDAFILAGKTKTDKKIFNIGTGKPVSINYVASLISKNKINIPKRPGEPDKTYANILLAKKDLKYYPKVKFKDGLKVMLDGLSSWKKAPLWTKKSIKKNTKDWFKYIK
jgi:UDP-glucose 4-epimerase